MDPHTNGGDIRLCRLYPYIEPWDDEVCELEVSESVGGGYDHDMLSNHFNDPRYLDLDSASFMMLSLDLPRLIGLIARPANRRMRVKDLREFGDWVYVISDPVVVRIFGGNDDRHRAITKQRIISQLRRVHGLSLTSNDDSLILSKNQVNISVLAIAETLHNCGARLCRVNFFGMKWKIAYAEPLIDGLIERYVRQLGDDAVLGKNCFDIGVVEDKTSIHVNLFQFDIAQYGRYNEGRVHLMFNNNGFGSVDFALRNQRYIRKIKIYQEICHDILSIIKKEFLDDMPKRMQTMWIRFGQMENLLQVWRGLTLSMRRLCFSGTRIEVTVYNATKVNEARRIVSDQGVLHLNGIERLLGGPFGVQQYHVNDIVANAELKIEELRQQLLFSHGGSPGIRVRCALTAARQAIGWSGKHMNSHLDELHRWTASLELRAQRNARTEDGQANAYNYDGWELDDHHQRPRIQDFLQRAKWCVHGRFKNRGNEPALMLQKVDGGGYWKKSGVYEDQAGAARHFLRLFGANWDHHIASHPIRM